MCINFKLCSLGEIQTTYLQQNVPARSENWLLILEMPSPLFLNPSSCQCTPSSNVLDPSVNPSSPTCTLSLEIAFPGMEHSASWRSHSHLVSSLIMWKCYQKSICFNFHPMSLFLTLGPTQASLHPLDIKYYTELKMTIILLPVTSLFSSSVSSTHLPMPVSLKLQATSPGHNLTDQCWLRKP